MKQKRLKTRKILRLCKFISLYSNFRKEQMKENDNEFKTLGISIKNELSGKYVYSLDATPIPYEIREFRTSSKFI